MTAKTRVPPRYWNIDWRVEGTVRVQARTAEEAQAVFDARWGSPNFVSVSAAEVSNDPPVEEKDPA